MADDALNPIAEQTYRLIFENSEDGLMLVTPDGRTLDANPAACRILGYTREELIARGRNGLVDATDLRFAEYLQKRSENGYATDELTFLCKNNLKLPVEISSRNFYNEQGEAYVSLSFRDITERKRAEEALRQSEAKFARMFQSSPIATFISTLAEGRILDANDRTMELFEYTRDEMIGHTSFELDVWPDPEVRTQIVALLHKQGYIRDFDITYKSRSGKIHAVRATYELIELDGKTRILSLLYDITPLKQAAQTQTLLASIVESSDDAITSKTLDGIILSWNLGATRIYGYTAEEAIGRSISILESPACPDDVFQLLERIKHGEQVSHYETIRRRKDGSDINVSLTISPIKDKAGTIIGASTIARDITERKQTQQALEASKQQVTNVLESIRDAFYTLDSEERFTYVNHKTEELWNMRREDLIGKWIGEVFPQMVKAPAFHNLRHALTEQIPVAFETYSDHLHQWVDVKVYPVQGGISVYFQDISDRKRAEEALRQSEKMYRLLARNLPDSSVLIFDRDMRYLIAEGGALTKHGFSSEMLEGKTLQEVLQPENVARLLPYYQAALAGLENTYEDYFDDRVYLVRAVPIRNEQGSITAGMLFSEDITALKKAEQILADEKEQLSVTLRSIGDGVITTDLNGRVTLLNRVAEELTGWSQVEAIGRPLADIFQIIDEKTRQTQKNPVDETLNTGQIMTLRNHTLLVARDGSERMIADSCAPIRDQLSKIIGTVLVFRDITEQQKIAEELQKASKLEALGVLAGGIAHDFNNLLTGIIGFLDLAEMQFAYKNGLKLEEVESFVEEANKAALRAKTLTLQLLTFARGGAPVKKTTQLVQLIRDSASFVLHGSNVEPVFELENELWSVEVDTGQVGQVIQNLVLNAAQAMPEGGFVKIRGQNVELTEGAVPQLTVGKYVLLSIQDKGQGIPPENLTKIFDPYFTTKPQGSGLGLAVCFSIVKKHNGYIQVESEVGKGTTFYIYLSVSKSLVEVQAPLAKSLPLISPRVGSIKLLIMDDESVLRELIKRTLQKYGQQVELAKDGQEALALYQTALEKGQPFDVVLLDLTIPGGMGGKQTMAKLLELDPQVKAIVCSGYSSDPIMSNYRDYGFKDVLLKPYRLEELTKVLDRVTAA